MGKGLDRIKYWAQIFLVPLYGLSYLAPRNKKLWLFGSTFGRRFSENPRYMYLYVSQHKEDETSPAFGIRPIWISHNKEAVSFLTKKGYEAYYYHSLKGILLALRAGVYIFDNYSKDINFWQSGRALKINLWHGSGNKQTNHDNIHDRVRHPRNAWERWTTWLRRLSDEKPYHYTLATSDAMAKIYTSAFNTDIEHILVCGNTRNDVFFPEEESGIQNLYSEKELMLRSEIVRHKKAGRKILAYLPTFRDSEKLFFDVMDMGAFDAYLKERGYVLAAKLHPKSRIRSAFEAVQGENILNINSEMDVYSFFDLCDVLITDYSSAYTDFMLTKRPVVAFDFDWEEYSKDSRECYIDQDEYMPEIKAMTMEELMRAIDEVVKCDTHLPERLVSRERMFKYIEGSSSRRMTAMVKELVVGM